MSFLNARIPPPILCFGVLVAMGRLARRMPPTTIAFELRAGCALLLFLVGITCLVASHRSFSKQGTTSDPTHPSRASSMVSTGIFRFSRNPMYVGYVALTICWAVCLNRPLLLFAPILMALYLTQFQILPEERALDRKFGEQYRDYRSRVRRWI